MPPHRSAAVPVVAVLHDEPVGAEAEHRHPDQVFAVAIGQLSLGGPGHSRPVTVDNRLAELALRRFLLREHAGQITRLRIAERVLLPERPFGVKRTDSGRVMVRPAVLPYLRPPLGGLSCVHGPTLDNATDKRPAQTSSTRPLCGRENGWRG